MAYLLNGVDDYFSTPTPNAFFPVTIGCRVFIADATQENGCPFSNTDQTPNNIRGQLRLTTNGLVAWTVKGILGQHGTFGTYQNGWNSFVCVIVNNLTRHLFVNGVQTTTNGDAGQLSGISTLLIGARYDSTGTNIELPLNGRIEEFFVSSSAWTFAENLLYRAGVTPVDIPTGNVVFYRNFMRNTTAPGPGAAPVTTFGLPLLHDQSALFTGQTTKRLTITGSYADVVATAATLVYTPDADYVGVDDLEAVALDDAFNVAVDNGQINVEISGGAPVNTVPGEQYIFKDEVLSLPTLSVDDPDGDLYTVRLRAFGGTQHIDPVGAAFIGIGLVDTDDFTIFGPQADIAATLATYTLEPKPGFTGTLNIAMTSTDNTAATDVSIITVYVSEFIQDPREDVPVEGSSVRVFIDGVEKTGLVENGTLSFERELHTRGSARFTLISKGNPGAFYRPRIGQIVRIEYENEGIFGGTIENITEQQVRGRKNVLFTEVEMVSWEQICDRFLVADGFKDLPVHQVVYDLWASHLVNDGIVIAQIDAGPILEAGVWNYDPLTQVLNDLGGLFGFDWWIDVDKGLYFVKSGGRPAPFTLTNEGQCESLSYAKERQDYRNRQFVRAGNDTTDTRIERITGDGQTRSFLLSFSVGAVPTEIAVNDIPQTFGVRGRDDEDSKEFFYNVGNQTINQSTFSTPLLNTDVLKVTYKGLFPLLVVSQDDVEIERRKTIEGGSGVYEAVADRQEVQNGSFAFAFASKELKEKGIIPAHLRFSTRLKGLLPGQLLPVNLIEHGINESLLIESVSFSERMTDPIEFLYEVRCIGGAALGGWAEFFVRLAKAGKKFQFRENEIAGPLKLFAEPVDIAEVFTVTQDFDTRGIIDVDTWGEFEWI